MLILEGNFTAQGPWRPRGRSGCGVWFLLPPGLTSAGAGILGESMRGWKISVHLSNKIFFNLWKTMKRFILAQNNSEICAYRIHQRYFAHVSLLSQVSSLNASNDLI